MEDHRIDHVRTPMSALAIGGLGTPELLIILAVLVLLFGASKLPELARGSGRALRIFKAETKGLMDDDDEDEPESTQSSPRAAQASSSSRPSSATWPSARPSSTPRPSGCNRGDTA